MAWDTILFDLDGTLTDSGPGIINGVEYTVEQMGLPRHERSFYRRFIGPPLQWSFQEFCGLDSERAREAVRVYRSYYNEKGIWENTPYPGIQELLASLSGAGKTLAVATSKPEPLAVRVLERFALMPYLRCVAGASPDESRDQKPEAIRRCLRQCGGQAVMVGDRFYDIQGAHENHIPAIGVLYGYGSREEFERAGAEALAADASELERLLLSEMEIKTKE